MPQVVVARPKTKLCDRCRLAPCECWLADTLKMLKGPLSPQLLRAIADGSGTFTPDKYEETMKTIFVKTQERTIRQIRATDVGEVVAYHPTPEGLAGLPWTVTHAFSGHTFGAVESEARARWLAEKLAAVLVPASAFNVPADAVTEAMAKRGVQDVCDALRRIAKREAVDGDRETVAAYFAKMKTGGE